MKNIIGILLIIALIAVSIMGYLSEKEEINMEFTNKIIIEEELEEEVDGHHEGVLIDYDIRETSVIDIDNIEAVFKYLDPHETQNYEDLLTVYASYIPLCVSDIPKDFYKTNRQYIGDILSIYSLDEYIDFNNKIKKSGLTNNSILIKIEILNLEQKGRLLNAHTRIFYDNASLCMANMIDYVYIGKEASLFMYYDEVMPCEK